MGLHGKAIRWSKLDIELSIASVPPTRGGTDELITALAAALRAWSVQDAVRVGSIVENVHGVAEDGQNTVLLQDRPSPAPALWVEGKTRGATQPYVRQRDGYMEIVETDIVVAPSAIDWSKPVGKEQLQAVLVHEIGQLLGFDHTCVSVREPDGPRPLCSRAGPSVREAAMYPDPLEPGRKLALVPTDAERAAVLTLYGIAPALHHRWVLLLSLVVVVILGVVWRWRTT